MILALDFDGVLHPRVTQHEPLFCRLDLLEAWLRSHVEIDVVIASSWREYHPLDEMVEYFSPDLRQRIAGVTPIARQIRPSLPYPAVEPAYERQFEVEAWCESRGLRRDAWIALDDDPRLFEPGCSRLVLCDPNVGLRPGTLFKLSRVLQACSAR